MPAAIFDVDRTILDGMSGYLFSAWLWKTRRMPAAGRLRTARSLLLYRIGLRPETELVTVGVTALAGLSPDQARKYAEQCVDEVIWPRVYAEAAQKIAEHKRAGDFVILASGSAQPVVEALARRIGADEAVGTRPRSERGPGGRLLPRAELPLCYKEGKSELVRRALDERGLRVEDAAFYSDNGPDVPLLETVAHPFAVNPDRVLLAHANDRGWPVLSWTALVEDGRVSSGTRWPLK